MKVSYPKFASTLLGALLLAVFAAQSAYANCLIPFRTSDGQTGVIGCGSSAGDYAMLSDGTDVTDQFIGLVRFVCAMGCGDEGYITQLKRDPSKSFVFRYPRSYALTRARFIESKRSQSTNAWSVFADEVTV